MIPLVLTAATGGLMALVFPAALLLFLRKVVRDHIPKPVLDALTTSSLRDDLIRVIVRVAQFANLTPAERKAQALQWAKEVLQRHGVHLSDSQLSLLIELLYQWVKRHLPHTIQPGPADWTTPVPGNSR